jgi:hypothetical protein
MAGVKAREFDRKDDWDLHRKAGRDLVNFFAKFSGNEADGAHI